MAAVVHYPARGTKFSHSSCVNYLLASYNPIMSGASPETIGIASLNLLLDKTFSSDSKKGQPNYIEPQHERIDSLSRTLGSLPIPLDVVMLQEVQINREFNNGERLMENLGIEKGFWVQHNQRRDDVGRSDEYLGVIGDAIGYVEAFDVGDYRKALLTIVGGIAMIGIHHRSRYENRDIRTQQMKAVLDRIRDFDKAIILGDSNELPMFKSRRMLSDEGFRSVYKMKRRKRALPLPATYPTENYRNIRFSPAQRKTAPRGVSLDIIELRGFKPSEVVNAGVRIPEKSDHKAVFAKLAPK